MSIRQKTLVIIAITLVGLITLLYASSRSILLQSFHDLEQSTVRRSVQRAQSAVSADLSDLARVAAAWAARDDAAAFVRQPDDAFVATYLGDTAFSALRLNALLFVNDAGEVSYGDGFDLIGGERRPLPPELLAQIEDGTLLGDGDAAAPLSGIATLPEGPLLLAYSPLTAGGASGGGLIFGRFLSQREVERLAQEYDVLMTLYALDTPALPDDVRAVQASLHAANRVVVQPLDTHVVAGYALLDDLHGSPALILKTSLSRDIYEQGQVSIWYFMLALVAAGVVFGVMILLLLEQTVLSRLAQLSAGVNRIGRSSDPSIRVGMRGRDEVARLARTVDKMLEALEQSQAAERAQRLMAEALRDTAAALTGTLNLNEVLERILTNVGHVVAHDAAHIMLVEGDTLRVAGARGFAPDDRIFETIYRYAEIPLLYEAMRAERVALLNDTRTDPRWVPLPGLNTNTRAWIGVPLVAHSVIIGFLSVASNEPNAYTPADLEAVDAFAQQAALAVENARILAELETSLDELRKAQGHLMRTTRLSAAGQIAAGVAHQINNPLTTILAESHLLLEARGDDHPDADTLRAIRDSAHRAGEVVRRLLDLTRTHPYEMCPLDVNASLQSSIALVRAQLIPHVARLEVELAPDLPPITGSAHHLEDVWINLLLNARDALSQAGEGVITVGTGLAPGGDSVQVTVRDNGPGIAPDRLAHIFEPFFTTKDYGTGLGLSICQEIIARHRGTLHVASTPGAGTTLTICLPLDGRPD